MPNERNAGRKPQISDEEIERIRERQQGGESIAEIAEEYGVSRQALYKRLKANQTKSVRIDYMIDGQHVAEIDADFRDHRIVIMNYVVELSKLPFGLQANPSWQDFCDFLEDEYLRNAGVNEPGTFLITEGEKTFCPGESERLRLRGDVPDAIPVFHFTKRDILYTRTDTDGFQMKALSENRKYFVKSQAILSGVLMRDWAVEIIASDVAGQLGIPHVEQHHCRFAFGKKCYDGVYSLNFELDGYEFISFESLLERNGLSSGESYFVKLGAIEKLKWCAEKLSEIGRIPYEKTFRYMLDLAVLDCLVGNVDRHTKNFGLFYHSLTGEYSVPLVFDNGMGLFEHDYYRDQYASFEDAMHNVYVSPYGEDPFDFLQMLNDEFQLIEVYRGVEEIAYPDILHTDYAKEYERRMQSLWRKFD